MTRVLMRWEPFEDVVSLRDAMDRLFEESFVRPRRAERGARNGGSVASLPVDVYETDDELVVNARVPGMNPDEVEVTIHGDTVTIRGELHSAATDEESKNWKWHTHELWHGPLGRTITLPTLVDVDKVEAHFENGLLALRLPKAEEVKPRVIKVQTA
jgi:HSP20 family protein